MSTDDRHAYRFSTAAHWKACLFVQLDREALANTGVRPFAPYALPAKQYGPPNAHAPAATRFGGIVWRDDAGHLDRMAWKDDEPESFAVPRAIARARRIVVNAHGMWVAGEPSDSLERYEEDTLTRVLTVGLPARAVDIAGDLRDRIFALVFQGDEWRAVSVECHGLVRTSVVFEGIADARAFVYLRTVDRFVVLAGASQPRLYWFGAGGGAPLVSIPIGAVGPCFSVPKGDEVLPSVLGTDSRDRVFLAGIEDYEGERKPYVVFFDGDGNVLGDLALDELATGVTATRRVLWVSTARGLLGFSATDVVPPQGREVRVTVVTPMLESPDREDQRRWLRTEASANLPPGASLEIAYAATSNVEVRDRLSSIAKERGVPESVRAQRLAAERDLWSVPIVFHGRELQTGETQTPFSAPLFDVRERYLWIRVTLIAAAGAALPSLSSLAVLYPGHTLMEHLPGIYQRAESEPKNFLRGLVGVLESTTQDLDERIAAMGRHVNPATAEPPWLDFIARWLGLPWDDTLSPDQKRHIVTRAADLARGRGTRAGLDALLESLIPGSPRRFRVTDVTADFGFAIVGGDDYEGSTLPSMLAGFSRWSTALDGTAVVGVMRLPCGDLHDDGTWQFSGTVRVDVAASAAERRAWEPWLYTLIQQMVPLTSRVQLRWVAADALRSDVLDDTLTLAGDLTPHLGTDAVTGTARLPDRPSRLSAAGPDIGIRLH